MARTLITRGADTSVLSADGRTALQLAEEHEHEVVGILRRGRRGQLQATQAQQRQSGKQAEADTLASAAREML